MFDYNEIMRSIVHTDDYGRRLAHEIYPESLKSKHGRAMMMEQKSGKKSEIQVDKCVFPVNFSILFVFLCIFSYFLSVRTRNAS